MKRREFPAFGGCAETCNCYLKSARAGFLWVALGDLRAGDYFLVNKSNGTSIEAPTQNFLSVLLPSKIVREWKPYRMCRFEVV